MSGEITRISLDEAGDGLTDWDRLRAMTDDDIDAAIRADPDTFTAEVGEWLGQDGDAHRYYVYSDQNVWWRWKFVDHMGEVIAVSGHGYESRNEVLAAIEALRRTFSGAEIKAA